MSLSLKDDVLKAVRDDYLGGYIHPASVKPAPPKTGSKIKKPCTYETPCGWCAKWDKKCDRKIPERGLRAKLNPVDDAIEPCGTCENNGWDMPQCKECNIKNGFQYYRLDRRE